MLEYNCNSKILKPDAAKNILEDIDLLKQDRRILLALHIFGRKH